MSQLETKIDRQSAQFKRNHDTLISLVGDLTEKTGKLSVGGSRKAREKTPCARQTVNPGSYSSTD